MKNWLIIVLFSAALAGCASVATPPEAPAAHLFHDHLFAPPAERISADDVFALSPAMLRYLDKEIAPDLRTKGRHKALYDALYSKYQLKIDYDAEMTRNAMQTFDSRSGNCLSLVIMTAAFARQLGLTVQYNNVLTDETWSRNGGLHFAIGHVNLTLGRRHFDMRNRSENTDRMIIDFLPGQDLANQRSRSIEESTIVAMYMNNRAAEALVQDRLGDAYWWARAAIGQDPGFMGSFNTLGVVYRRHGNIAYAEQALRHVLQREPRNTIAMSNLAQLLQADGRTGEANTLAAQLQRLEPYPPFQHFYQGMAAMRSGDYASAKALFAREVERDPHNHELQYWLASAYWRLGEMQQARRHLGNAIEESTTRDTRALYAAKLERIKNQSQ